MPSSMAGEALLSGVALPGTTGAPPDEPVPALPCAEAIAVPKARTSAAQDVECRFMHEVERSSRSARVRRERSLASSRADALPESSARAWRPNLEQAGPDVDQQGQHCG